MMILLNDDTFMVEMSEVANIFKKCNENSLLILRRDPDVEQNLHLMGLSIAWAVVEYISNSKLLSCCQKLICDYTLS